MFNVIKKVFLDVIIVYKNFIHWNISKILINIFAFLLGLLFSLPVLAILGIFIYLDPINWKEIISNYILTNSIGMGFLSAISNNLVFIIIEAFILILAISLFIFGYSYKLILLTNLYFGYLDGEKIDYFKNIYFSKEKILTFLYIWFWGGLILLIPFLIFIIIFFTLILYFGGIEQTYQIVQLYGFLNPFSIILLSGFIILLLVFIYLSYRITFSYIAMLDKKRFPERQKGIFYIKDSWKITSGLKIFKPLFFTIIFIILMIPLDIIGIYIEGLNNLIIYIFYEILIFLTIGGVFEMLFVSIYKNVMIDNDNIDKHNEKNKELKEDEVL